METYYSCVMSITSGQNIPQVEAGTLSKGLRMPYPTRPAKEQVNTEYLPGTEVLYSSIPPGTDQFPGVTACSYILRICLTVSCLGYNTFIHPCTHLIITSCYSLTTASSHRTQCVGPQLIRLLMQLRSSLFASRQLMSSHVKRKMLIFLSLSFLRFSLLCSTHARTPNIQRIGAQS